MIVGQITTARFRNLADQRIDPGPFLNVVAGDNAQGKTNFLEAVVVLGWLRSFRAMRVGDLVRFGETRAMLRATVDSGDMQRELQVELRQGGRRAWLDGKAVRGGAGYFGTLQAVVFTPEDLQVPRGGPAERRRLLDRAILTLWPGYLAVGRDYQRTLQSRNRVLRERPGGTCELLEVYDQQLAELGAKVVASRLRYLRLIGNSFSTIFGQIMKKGQGTLRYRTPLPMEEARDSVEELVELMREQLRRKRGVDQLRQTTTSGPHMDDLDFELDGRSLRCFGSQGQVRAAVLAFRLGQVLEAKEKTGAYPVLLLDDVSSELDPERNKYLFDFIGKVSCQTFLTTTRPGLIPRLDNRINFNMLSGQMTRADE